MTFCWKRIISKRWHNASSNMWKLGYFLLCWVALLTWGIEITISLFLDFECFVIRSRLQKLYFFSESLSWNALTIFMELALDNCRIIVGILRNIKKCVSTVNVQTLGIGYDICYKKYKLWCQCLWKFQCFDKKSFNIFLMYF